MIILILIAVLILNPYAVFGPVGYYFAFPLVSLAVLGGLKYSRLEIIGLFLICIFISLIGVFSSVVHGIPQINHFKASVLILTNYLIGVGLFVLLRKSFKFDDILIIVLCVGVANGLTILAQVQYPQFRAIIESVLIDSGNIDWQEGFRYRGLASGGGASLSVLSALMVYIGLYLYGIGRIGIFSLLVSIAILSVSVLFVGRTGVLLIFMAFLLKIALSGFRSFKILLLLLMCIPLVVLFGHGLIKDYLIYQYGEEFYLYALGFILQGKDGIANEGTVGIIADFLMVVPKQFPQIFTGYGFYGEGYFEPWTDSGYSRMFLSVGFIFGFIYYLSVALIFMKSVKGKIILFLPLIILLVIAETKEPLLLTGYSSRLLFLLLGFWVAERIYNSRRVTDISLHIT
jgi:hypothetical protein